MKKMNSKYIKIQIISKRKIMNSLKLVPGGGQHAVHHYEENKLRELDYSGFDCQGGPRSLFHLSRLA